MAMIRGEKGEAGHTAATEQVVAEDEDDDTDTERGAGETDKGGHLQRQGTIPGQHVEPMPHQRAQAIPRRAGVARGSCRTVTLPKRVVLQLSRTSIDEYGLW